MRKNKIIVTIVLIVVLASVLAGCGGNVTQIARPKVEEGAQMFEVTGSCKAVLNGSVLTVSGETNLMDGTNGVISVMGSGGALLDSVKLQKQGNNLTADFAVQADWPETVYGFLTFDTQKADTQLKEVREVYGNKFENLSGPNVVWNQKGCVATFQSEPVKVK